jgi:hypothetical protein
MTPTHNPDEDEKESESNSLRRQFTKALRRWKERAADETVHPDERAYSERAAKEVEKELKKLS